MPRLFRPRVLPVARRAVSPASWNILKSFDEMISDKEIAARTPYRTLRKFLDGVPVSQRGIEYTERVVCLYSAKRMKGARCYALVEQMRERRNAEGKASLFADFDKRLAEITHPYALTFHGFSVPFQDRDAKEIASELHEIVTSIQAIGYPVFINSGTLLGAVRENDFILHDDDADLAVILPATDDKDVLKALYRLHDDLAKVPGLDIDGKFLSKSPVLKISMKSGLTVDLFPAWWREDRLHVWPHTRGELDRDDVLPLGSENIGGKSFPAPRKPEKMLSVNYGSGWGVPDPHFRFNWQRARERFRPIIKKYRRDRLRDRCVQMIRKFRPSKLG